IRRKGLNVLRRVFALDGPLAHGGLNAWIPVDLYDCGWLLTSPRAQERPVRPLKVDACRQPDDAKVLRPRIRDLDWNVHFKELVHTNAFTSKLPTERHHVIGPDAE